MAGLGGKSPVMRVFELGGDHAACYLHPMSFQWYHTQIWLYGHWLPGEARGFRSKDHRVHSSGDYKRRPPVGEHAGLYRHAAGLLKAQPISLAMPQRACVGSLIVRWFEKKRISLAAVSVGGAHAHVLCLLPIGDEDKTVGKVKRYASTESSRRDPTIPPKLFAAKGEPKRVDTWRYFTVSHEYVLDHASEGAWVWGVDARDLPALWELRG